MITMDERIAAVARLGFTERQARFLDLVMVYGGLCVPRQYATFAGTAYGHTVSRFFDKLVRGGYATVSDCLHSRAELYHVRHRALYRAIDQPDSRYRRPVPARHVVDRLMRLDAVVLQPELIWLATEEEKVAFFSLMAPSFPRERLPHVVVGQGAGGRLRLFPDDQPVGVTTTGRVVFTYLVTAWETAALRAFVQRHADLLRALPGWTLRLVLPQQLADSAPRFEGAVRDELTPLRPQLLAELKWYFAKRRGTPNPRALSFEDPEFWEHQAAFSSPRFQQLYRRWLTDGDTAFEAVASPVLTDALERGTGTIESRSLLLSYRHLAPLVSLFRSRRKGVEGGDTWSAPSQPPPATAPSGSADATVADSTPPRI
jgi:hypothetical protein